MVGYDDQNSFHMLISWISRFFFCENRSIGSFSFFFFFCRTIYQRGVVQAGEHAGELLACKFAAYWDYYSASKLPTASSSLLSAQHQHGVSAQRTVTLSGICPQVLVVPIGTVFLVSR